MLSSPPSFYHLRFGVHAFTSPPAPPLTSRETHGVPRTPRDRQPHPASRAAPPEPKHRLVTMAREEGVGALYRAWWLTMLSGIGGAFS